MRHLVEQRIRRKIVEESDIINDDLLFRESCAKLVWDIPMDELRKLITLVKVDPEVELKKGQSDIASFNQLLMLKKEECILYKASIDLP